MNYKIDSFAKAFVACFVMVSGFLYNFILLFGEPTTVLAVIFLVVLSALCLLAYLWWIKGDKKDGK